MWGEESRGIRGWGLGGVDLFLLRQMRFVGLEAVDGKVGEGFGAWGLRVGHEFPDSLDRYRQFPRVDRI